MLNNFDTALFQNFELWGDDSTTNGNQKLLQAFCITTQLHLKVFFVARQRKYSICLVFNDVMNGLKYSVIFQQILQGFRTLWLHIASDELTWIVSAVRFACTIEDWIFLNCCSFISPFWSSISKMFLASSTSISCSCFSRSSISFESDLRHAIPKFV